MLKASKQPAAEPAEETHNVMYQGASTTQPCTIEPADGTYRKWPVGAEMLATHHGQSSPVSGCCGAFQAKNMDEFNRLEIQKPSYDVATNMKSLNRGLLLMVNPVKEEVLTDVRFPVEYVQCGDDVLAVRRRDIP